MTVSSSVLVGALRAYRNEAPSRLVDARQVGSVGIAPIGALGGRTRWKPSKVRSHDCLIGLTCAWTDIVERVLISQFIAASGSGSLSVFRTRFAFAAKRPLLRLGVAR